MLIRISLEAKAVAGGGVEHLVAVAGLVGGIDEDGAAVGADG